MKLKIKILPSLFTVVFVLLYSFATAQPANLPQWVAEESGQGIESGGSAEGFENISYYLPAISIIDIEGSAPSLTFGVPSEAGLALSTSSSNQSWINYTSVNPTGISNKVTVTITNGVVPQGTQIKLTAAPYSGNGNGITGTPSNQTAIALSNLTQNIIGGIGSCYTGDGINKGHQLTYSWLVADESFSNLIATSGTDIIVTYTIIAE